MRFLCNAGRLKLTDIKLKSTRVPWHERNMRVWEACENATGTKKIWYKKRRKMWRTNLMG